MKTTINILPGKKIAGVYVLALFLLAMVIGCNSGPPKNTRAAQAVAGKALFIEQCAGCHGGEGVVVEKSLVDSLTAIPPDLARINKRRGVREFPVAEIARIIDGRILTQVHGPREMPVWGQVYEDEGMEEGEIKGKKGELIAYLMSLQTMD